MLVVVLTLVSVHFLFATVFVLLILFFAYPQTNNASNHLSTTQIVNSNIFPLFICECVVLPVVLVVACASASNSRQIVHGQCSRNFTENLLNSICKCIHLHIFNMVFSLIFLLDMFRKSMGVMC